MPAIVEFYANCEKINIGVVTFNEILQKYLWNACYVKDNTYDLMEKNKYLIRDKSVAKKVYIEKIFYKLSSNI